MNRQFTVDTFIQLALAIVFGTVQADPITNGPQTFESKTTQNAQRYKEVIMYLTPTQIRNYEAGHGLPSSPQTAAAHTYEQQKSDQIPIHPKEGQIIQSTLDILEANKLQFQYRPSNADLQYSKTQSQYVDVRPIEEPNTEPPLLDPRVYITPKEPEQEQKKVIKHTDKEQDQIAISYSYVHPFSNQKLEDRNKIQLFHPEPRYVNLNEMTKLQNKQNFEFSQHPREKYKLIPYEYISGTNQEIHQQVREKLAKEENKAQLQFFIPAPPQQQDNKEMQNSLNGCVAQQYAPQFSSNNNNVYLKNILHESQLEREAAKIHAENIAKSPAVVIRKDISLIRRRPFGFTRDISIPYSVPFLVPVPYPIEVKVPQPYAVPIEIVKHIPVFIKTQEVEVEKHVPFEEEKNVPQMIEEKLHVPVEKPYTVERIVPVEINEKIPAEIPVSRPEKFTTV